MCVLCLSFSYCLFLADLWPRHLLRKEIPFGSLVRDVFLCLRNFTIWYTGSGVVLECIDS